MLVASSIDKSTYQHSSFTNSAGKPGCSEIFALIIAQNLRELRTFKPCACRSREGGESHSHFFAEIVAGSWRCNNRQPVILGNYPVVEFILLNPP